MKFIYSIFIAISPNFFWLILSFFLNVNRSYINLDYFIPLFLYIYGCRKLSILFFIILSFFDFLNIFSQIFPFIRFSDLFYLIKFSLISSVINFIIPIFYFIYLLIYFVLLNTFNNKIDKISIFIVFNILIFVLFFQNIYFENVSNRLWKYESKNIVQSQVLNSYELRSEGFVKSFDTKGNAFNDKISISASASESLFEFDNNKNKILLIVNESWGVARNNSVNIDIISDLIKSDFVEAYSLKTINVNGYTINAEIRELCRKDLSHFNLKNQINGFEHCLPNLYKKNGYDTYAMHAATGAMYDRKYWYPRAGFQNLIFRDTVSDLKSRCYSFPGFCDRDLNGLVVQAFRNEKIFFYWLTLNTHINYDLRDLKNDIFDCTKYNIKNNNSSCRNLKLQKQFFFYLAELIKKPEMKGVYVTIVGDHAPPTYAEDKDVFLENEVSILKFKVR